MPTPGHEGPLKVTPIMVFQDAGPIQKVVMIILLAAIVAALIVLVIKLAQGKRLSGGSAFLSGLRLGAPIIGVLGACLTGLNMTLGVANVPFPVTPKMLAPGIAESLMMLSLGLLAGVVAVVAHWVVESRIDRQVLGG
jgi:biopolymer transport protein ExbB/TolQ